MSDYVTRGEFVQFTNESTKLAKERHQQNNKITNDLLRIDAKLDKMNKINTELALLKQNHDNMKQDVEEIKQLIKDGFDEMEDKFMLKEEYKQFADKTEFTKIQTKVLILIGTITTISVIVLGILLEKLIK